VNAYFQLQLHIFGGHFETIITVPVSDVYLVELILIQIVEKNFPVTSIKKGKAPLQNVLKLFCLVYCIKFVAEFCNT
jgi:hypothetical protein